MVGAITPRPIAWVSTISDRGISNLAPFSYFNGVCSTPAALMFSPVNRPDGSKKDTLLNIEANRQFVVNVVPFQMAEPMFQTAGDFVYEVSEFEKAGLESRPGIKVQAPHVVGSPVRFECELIQIVPIGEGPLAASVVIGQILLIDIDDEILDEQGEIDPGRLDSIGRLGGKSYCRTTERYDLRPH